MVSPVSICFSFKQPNGRHANSRFESGAFVFSCFVTGGYVFDGRVEVSGNTWRLADSPIWFRTAIQKLVEREPGKGGIRGVFVHMALGQHQPFWGRSTHYPF